MPDEFHRMLTFPGEAGPVQAYLARPDSPEPRPAVIVVHEIYGLDDHIKSVADRFAAAGYVALAPHLYSRPGLAEVLTLSNVEEAMRFNLSLPPEKMADAAFVQQKLAELPAESREIVQSVRLILFGGGLPRASLTQDLVHAADYLSGQSFVTRGKIASLGFCFGGGMSLDFACHARLAASVVFYGQNPDPIAQVENIAGPVLGLYGADDMRINAHLDELVRAMTTYRKDFEMRIYPGAAHAFFNDTRLRVYREAAAKDAWERVLNFFRRTLVAA
jgi:carboxymethylenebutenolidase